jgi:ADP-heptose:LPS heptosyltransferase
MWLKERFAATAATLAGQQNAPVLLFGSAAEAARCDEIASMVRETSSSTRVVSLAGSLSLLETAAAMDHCGVVITNDSGLMHIAAARKRKVVALFGPTVRQFGFFPFGTASTVVEHPALPCRPCTHIGLPDCPRGHFRCMRELESGTVIQAATALLENDFRNSDV